MHGQHGQSLVLGNDQLHPQCDPESASHHLSQDGQVIRSLSLSR